MKCVLCGSSSGQALYSFNHLTITKCVKCGLVRTEGTPLMDYEKYHRDEDYEKFGKMFRNIFLLRYRLIKKFVKGKGAVLDIGASTGGFLEHFKDDSWEVWGVEPSKSGDLARKKGIKIIKETFEKAKLPRNYFDVVILNHTLEHVTNPVLFLKKAKEVLKSGGVLFIDVPNFGGLSSKTFGKHWRYLTPNEHLFHFTPKTLTKVVQASGFKVIHQESRSGLLEYGSPLTELWDALSSLKKRFVTDIVTFPFSFISTILNRGSSMSVLGRKE